MGATNYLHWVYDGIIMGLYIVGLTGIELNGDHQQYRGL